MPNAQLMRRHLFTDRRRPAYVLMRHDTYLRLTGHEQSLGALLADSEREDVAFEPPRLGEIPVRPADTG